MPASEFRFVQECCVGVRLRQLTLFEVRTGRFYDRDRIDDLIVDHRELVGTLRIGDKVVEIVGTDSRRVVDPVVGDVVAQERIGLDKGVVVEADRVGDIEVVTIFRLRHREDERVIVDLCREDIGRIGLIE